MSERRLTEEELRFFVSPGCEATWCRADVRAMAFEILERRGHAQAKALTDEELIAVTGFAENDEFLEQNWVATINMLVTELRARRAADLSAEDVEVLDGLRAFLHSRFGANHIGQRQIAVLSKLLGGRDA